MNAELEPPLEVHGRPITDPDVGEVISLLRNQVLRWNENRPIREQDFAPDSDYVTFDGTELHGFEANRRLHEELGLGVLRGSQLTCHVRRVRFLSDDVAVVHSVGNLRLRFHRRPKPSRNSVQTTVVRRTGDGWRIEAFQNTRIRRQGPIGRLLIGLLNRF